MVALLSRASASQRGYALSVCLTSHHDNSRGTNRKRSRHIGVRSVQFGSIPRIDLCIQNVGRRPDLAETTDHS